jgi:hypothetical protein
MDAEVNHKPAATRPDESALLTYINLKLAALARASVLSVIRLYKRQEL